MEKLTSSDAWIFQTIGHASINKPASLQEIIATGDMLNHAIFTSGELQKGFYKLYQLNWIQQENELYSLTNAGKSLLTSILDKALTPIKERDEISLLIKSSPWSPREVFPAYNPGLIPRFFTLEEFDKACKKYQKESWAIVKKIAGK